jgi:uncharacterized protein (DUF983 family)
MPNSHELTVISMTMALRLARPSPECGRGKLMTGFMKKMPRLRVGELRVNLMKERPDCSI